MQVIIEGFIVLIIFQAIGVLCFGWIFSYLLAGAPKLTINILSSSAISPVIAVGYLSLRRKFFPKFNFTRETLLGAVSGIVLTLMICLVEVFIFGTKNAFIRQIISASIPYYYINLFWFLVWGPFFEETLFRGCFYELLRAKGELFAILISSTMFALPHILFAGLTIDFYVVLEVLFIFARGLVFVYTYRVGGLLASTAAHIFANSYFLFLNAP